jgi:FtsP/CotA-like multicopper oxidase with cupredoxin domain
MGRFGNLMLVNGETDFNLTARQEEVVRFYLTNTANVRNFNLHIPGAKLKLAGGDSGRVEREEFVESLLLAPSERVVIEALFEQTGQFPIEHRTPEKSYQLGTVTVVEETVAQSFLSDFYRLRRSQELEALRREIAGDFNREPDKTIVLIGEMPEMKSMPSMKHGGGQPHVDEVEWEDNMGLGNGMSNSGNIFWQIVDRATGKANHDIDWAFDLGSRVKIRIENPVDSHHPMQHPMHFHGQRFLVLGRNGQINDNLVWKDSVLVKTGETVDILLDTSNPGTWMAHCHIAEHTEVGMMFNFVVKGEG